MHMDMSQEAFYAELFKENAVRVSRDAGEMHMDMSQEACGAEIDRENAKRLRYHLD